jgi:RNA polymerase sigma factor (sigma-70 family)
LTERYKTKRDEELEGTPSCAIEEHHPGLYRFLIRRLRGMQDAEDLAQDVYLRFLQVRHDDQVRQPQAYLYRIAANLVNEFSLRRKSQRVTYDSRAVQLRTDHPDDVWTDEVSEELSREQELEVLGRVLAQLPKAYQAVLLLRTRDGLSREQIAQRLGLSPQTVKKYLFRAVAHCRAARWTIERKPGRDR